MPLHECAPDRTCLCSASALEPNDYCPQHGFGEWPERCGTCGKWMRKVITLLQIDCDEQV